MIRFSTPNDVDALKTLWRRSFDDGDFVETFFDLLWKPQGCLVFADGQKIASMLFILPATVHSAGRTHPIHYIYACATDLPYRAQGVMGKLLNHAHQLATEQQQSALTLYPADEHLKKYYHRCGFFPCSVHKEWRLERAELPVVLSLPPVQPLTPLGLQRLRMQLLSAEGLVQWPVEHLEVEIAENPLLQRGAVWVEESNAVSYALYTTVGRKLQIKEFSTNQPIRWKEQLSALVQNLEFDVLEMTGPTFLPDGERCSSHTMIRPTPHWPTNCPVDSLFFNLCISD